MHLMQLIASSPLAGEHTNLRGPGPRDGVREALEHPLVLFPCP